MRLNIIVMLMIFNSCTPPVIKPQERCVVSLSFDYGTNEQVQDFFANLYLYDNRPDMRDELVAEFVSIFGKSRCVMYDLMTIQKIGEGYDKPLSYADDTAGFSVDSWGGKITPWARESKKYFENKCD